jgi:hypothetical protein
MLASSLGKSAVEGNSLACASQRGGWVSQTHPLAWCTPAASDPKVRAELLHQGARQLNIVTVDLQGAQAVKDSRPGPGRAPAHCHVRHVARARDSTQHHKGTVAERHERGVERATPVGYASIDLQWAAVSMADAAAGTSAPHPLAQRTR